IHPDKAAEARRLLRELGFSLNDKCDFAPPVETITLNEPMTSVRETATQAARALRTVLRQRREGG
ncbi:MAG: hypothetical protein ACM3U2_24000, partial [Deltaproteobacteria bacterium]